MSVAPLQLLKSEFNPLVYVALDNATDKFVSLAYYYGATTTTPSDAYFTKGALLVHATDGTTYQNTAADGATPTWGILGGGGGGIAIGDAITDADAASILYVDGSGNLTQDAGFTRDVATGNTNISSTYGGVTYGYKLDSDVFGGEKGTVFNFTNGVDEFGITGIINGGDGNVFVSIFQYASGSSSIFNISEKQSQLGISDGDTKDVTLTFDSDVGFNISQTISGVQNGIDTSESITTIGNLSGGNNTKITIDDVNQLVTISNVPTYADETTAIGAGLTTGQVYKSYDGQNYFLAIVH